MCIEFKEKAYAKVNFNLEVLPKREDGFHSIKSIFQTVDLYDELVVQIDQSEEESNCTVVCDSMELPQKNTLTNAYQAFTEIAGCKVPAVTVKLIKGIPSGGGLGGGSSDGAALIRVLEKFCGIKLSYEQLDYIAAKTGSDVFFFMHCDENGSGCAVVTGRGEKIKKITPRKDLFILFIFPEVSSSTKEAYELVDQMYEKNILLDHKSNIIDTLNAESDSEAKNRSFPTLDELETIYCSNPKSWNFINTFTPVLCSKYVAVNKAIEALKNRGADFTDMSGSGSTVFGVYVGEREAINACNRLSCSFNCKLVRVV